MARIRGVSRLLQKKPATLKPSKPWLAGPSYQEQTQTSLSTEPEPAPDSDPGTSTPLGSSTNVPTPATATAPLDKYLRDLFVARQLQKINEAQTPDEVRRAKDLIKSINEAYGNKPICSVQDARQLIVTQKVDIVQKIIGYKFADRSLLWEALQAAGSDERNLGTRQISVDGNKRLAYIGDALIRLAMAEAWYTRRQERVVINDSVTKVGSNKNLAAVGRRHGLDACISKNQSQIEIGDIQVATTVEAIIGAVYIDSQLADRIDNVRQVMRILGLLEDS